MSVFADLSTLEQVEFFQQLVKKGDAGLRAIQRRVDLPEQIELSSEQLQALDDAIATAAAIDVTPDTARAALAPIEEIEE